MPFDPTLPANGSPNSSAEMRAQLTGLHDEIATIPVGPPGADGADGAPGEVSAAALASAVLGTARNPSAVTVLGLAISDPPTQAEVQALAAKLDELIAAARREP